MKETEYYYPIVDCEHEGDIRSAVCEVVNAGGIIVRTEWDGRDCGEAYVVFHIPQGQTKKDMEQKLGRIYM